jgi:3-oxoacyl-[acyl-carrier-protein] synthase-3
LLCVRSETHPDIELVTYPAGGCLDRTTAGNLGDHLFLMDGKRVRDVFAPLMRRNLQLLRDDWPTRIKPAVGTDFDVEQVTRWYLHQANGVVVREAAQLLGLPADRVPINVDRYGNTSAASTLLLLDEDRRTGRVGPGDLIVFMWIGAGNGAMNGYAALVL